MKHLGILGAAVLVLLAAWWLFGRSSGDTTGPAKLVLPADVNDKSALVRSSNQLWQATPNHFDPVQVIGFLRLLNDSLDDDQWKAVTAAVFFAWGNHRGILPVRGALAALNEKLLPRFVRAGTIADLEGLIWASNTRSFDAAAIDALLAKLAETPLPKSGYRESRFSELVAAAVRAGDLKRARTYLSGIRWEEGTSDEAKQPAARVSAIVDLCMAGASGKFELAAVVREWQGQGADPIGRTALRPVLEQVALRAVRGQFADSPVLKIEDLFASSAAEAGAGEYWDRAVARSFPDLVEGVELTIRRVAVLLAAYGIRFQKADYEFDTWMKVGNLIVKTDPKDPLRAVKFFVFANAAATTDARRAASVKLVATGYLNALEFEKARLAVEASAKRVQEEEPKKAVETLLADVRKKEAADKERVAKQEKAIEVDRRRGRLQAMKDKLAAAKKYGRPPEEIRAIEDAVRSIEKDLTE